MNINNCQIIGRVTRDPEARNLPSGSMVVNIGIATNRTWKNSEGVKQEEVEFVNAVAFGKLADIIKQYVVKGQLIYIQGRLKTDSWEAKDGTKRSATKVIIENMQMGARAGEGGRKTVQGDHEEVLDLPEEINVDDIPY
jgi:single-strand DNA-binding protein